MFSSPATNLVGADTKTDSDVYVRDLSSKRTVLASRASGTSGAKGNDDSGPASLAGDGGSVAFATNAKNLDPLDFDDSADVYQRDIAELSPPPNTKITKAEINAKQGKANFAFKAIGAADEVQCALVKKHKRPKFEKCRSPKSYRGLRPGSYTFEARAVGAGGKDSTPARKKFEI